MARRCIKGAAIDRRGWHAWEGATCVDRDFWHWLAREREGNNGGRDVGQAAPELTPPDAFITGRGSPVFPGVPATGWGVS